MKNVPLFFVPVLLFPPKRMTSGKIQEQWNSTPWSTRLENHFVELVHIFLALMSLVDLFFVRYFLLQCLRKDPESRRRQLHIRTYVSLRCPYGGVTTLE